MKKAVILGCLVLFLTPIIWAQEKVESPVWKVGDKWTSRADNGWELTSEIIADEKDYYLSKTVIPEGRRKGQWKRFYSKKDFNLIRSLKDGKEDREDRDRMKKNLDFPLYPGKKWSYRYTVFAERVRRDVDMLSELKAVGFEDVEVPAGKFMARLRVRSQQSTKFCQKLRPDPNNNYFNVSLPAIFLHFLEA